MYRRWVVELSEVVVAYPIVFNNRNNSIDARWVSLRIERIEENQKFYSSLDVHVGNEFS